MHLAAGALGWRAAPPPPTVLPLPCTHLRRSRLTRRTQSEESISSLGKGSTETPLWLLATQNAAAASAARPTTTEAGDRPPPQWLKDRPPAANPGESVSKSAAESAPVWLRKEEPPHPDSYGPKTTPDWLKGNGTLRDTGANVAHAAAQDRAPAEKFGHTSRGRSSAVLPTGVHARADSRRKVSDEPQLSAGLVGWGGTPQEPQNQKDLTQSWEALGNLKRSQMGRIRDRAAADGECAPIRL